MTSGIAILAENFLVLIRQLRVGSVENQRKNSLVPQNLWPAEQLANQRISCRAQSARGIRRNETYPTVLAE